MNNKNMNLNLFNKFIKNHFKIISLQKNSAEKENKYFSPSSIEWKNSIYTFKNSLMNISASHDVNINKLILNYFNLRFITEFLHRDKYKPFLKRHLSLNKIFVSKADIKHTNSKAIVTLYTYNREKLVLLHKLKQSSTYLKEKKLSLSFKKGKKNSSKKSFDVLERWILLRNIKLRLDLNKYKFEEKLLYRLSNILEMYYNKRVEFNIVNLKSIFFNSEIFTEILTTKFEKTNIYPLKKMKDILAFANILRDRLSKESIPESSYDSKNYNYPISMLQNSSIDNNLKKVFHNILGNKFQRNEIEMRYILFNSIKRKNLVGVTLEAKGRLSRRYRADRAICKIAFVGGLANESSLQSKKLRGHLNSNIEYSIRSSKRRVGAFAVKGWTSSK